MTAKARTLEYLAQSATKGFWANIRVDQDSGCWLWTGAIKGGKSGGYGTIGIGRNRAYLAHRLSWEINIGPISAGLCVLHKCDVRPCVNPAHLFLGTYGDNARDREQKGRGVVPDCRGERAKWAKLSAEQARTIKASAERTGVLAKMYGVSPATICDLRKGRTWASL